MACLGFVRDKRGRGGVGKLLSVSGGCSDVEYFDSPDGPRLRRVSVPTSSLFLIELPDQTRVFVFDNIAQVWRVGRADGRIDKRALGTDEDQYHVRLPNGQSARFGISELFVRSAAAIDNAADYLGARLNETPYLFDGRRRIRRHLTRQRTAFGGMTGLASSAVELLEHQVNAARLILTDPIQRYLLADEVGLGKTIEAGIIVRQHVLDQPDTANVLIVVPDHLRQQWQSEMREKFFLSNDTGVQVVGWQQLAELDDEDITFLVVDEAHRLALHAFDDATEERSWYDRIRNTSAAVPRVLLLSGTPVLHQEAAFLAMLHVLDPTAYPLNEVEQFRERVLGRQVVADAMLDLTDEAAGFFVSDALARLRDAFPNDEHLNELSQRARALANEPGDSAERSHAIGALRAYLGENYRLHRRLLRTRRDDPRVRGLLPERTGTLIVDHEDAARAEAADFLDAWRAQVSASMSESTEAEAIAVTTLFALWVEAALSHPSVLLRHIDARLALRANNPATGLSPELRKILSTSWVFHDEEGFLRRRILLLKQASATDQRLTALEQWLASAHDTKNAVVFVDDTAVADSVALHLAEHLPTHHVIRYNGQQGLADIFKLSNARAVAVCDGTAEEGLNLQRYGAAILHFDLPLAPMRVEQRIGRVDRLEARGRFRNVVFRTESRYEQEWISCLTQTIRVFNRSVAPLQYVLSEAVAQLRSSFVSEGSEAFSATSAELASGPNSLDAELRRIRAQEAIDALETDAAASRAFFEQLTQADERLERGGAQELDSWVVDRLHFNREETKSRVVRYSYDLQRPTLIPLEDAMQAFRSSVDVESRRGDIRRRMPLMAATYDRYTAENSGIPLLRVGHPFIGALSDWIRTDDRGTSYVMWRCAPRLVPRQNDPLLFVRFDFVIEADVSTLVSGLPTGATPETIRRRADAAFPVHEVTIWLDQDLNQILDKQLLAGLSAPYDKSGNSDGYIDVNVSVDRWSLLESEISLGDWRDFCHRAASAAARLIDRDTALREQRSNAARQLRAKLSAARKIMEGRLLRLADASREAERLAFSTECEVDETVLKGIENPAIRIDAAGAVVLSGKPFPRV